MASPNEADLLLQYSPTADDSILSSPSSSSSASSEWNDNSTLYGEFDFANEKPHHLPRRKSSLSRILSFNRVSLNNGGSKHYSFGWPRSLRKILIPRWLYPTIYLQPPPKTLRKTAALDGLRGISAFSVVLFHFGLNFFHINAGFVPGHEPSMHLWYLPFFKYFYNGPAGVHVFFVISGYILSLRCLQHIKARNMEAFLKTLSSSTLRRSFRLLAPVSIVLMTEVFIVQSGFFNGLLNIRTPLFKTKLEQMASNVRGLGNLFSWADYHNNNFDDNLWTIGFEYRCSMALFTLLLAISGIRRPWKRRLVVAALIPITNVYDRWDFHLFLIGMLLADFDAFSKNSQEPKISGRHQTFWTCISLTGIWLCSYPMMEPADQVLSFQYVYRLGRFLYPIYSYRFAWSAGAACLVAGAMHSIHLRSVLESRFIQYLGRISYMLYIIHGPLVRAFGVVTVRWIWQAFGGNIVGNNTLYDFGVVAGCAIFLAVTLWLADLATRAIDDNCIRLARWFELQCTKE